jgi:hypothetical protein
LEEHEMPDDPPRLRQLLEREPGNMGAWRRLWWSIEGEDELERLEVVRDCVAANRSSDQAQALLGAHYAYYGHDVDAEVAFRKALELDAGSPAGLSLVQLLTGYGRWREAREVAKAVLACLLQRPDASVHDKASLAMAIHHAGDAQAAAEWAEKIGGQHISVWALRAHAAAQRGEFAAIPEPPDWTWRYVADFRTNAIRFEVGAGAQSEALFLAVHLLAFARTQEDIARITPWFDRALEVYDDSHGRSVALAGLLAAAWMTEALSQTPKLPVLHASLSLRLRGLPTGLEWVTRLPFVLDTNHGPEVAALDGDELARTIHEFRTGLLGGEWMNTHLSSTRIAWGGEYAQDLLIACARTSHTDDRTWFSALAAAYSRRNWLLVSECASQFLRLTEDRANATGDAASSSLEQAVVRSVVSPPYPVTERSFARHCLLEARFFSGEREAVVAEVGAAEAKQRGRPGQHWILRLDEHWRDVEKRGLATFSGA